MDRTLARRVLGATEKAYEPAYFIAIDPDVARDSCSRMNAGQMLAKYGVESNLCQLCHGKPGHNPYNISAVTGGQHHVVAGGGFVLKWGE